jgi:hypothetical protein
VLGGLLEVVRWNKADVDRQRILDVLGNAAVSISKDYLRRKHEWGGRYVTLPATYDENWRSNDRWSCVTGTAQLAFFLRQLAQYANDDHFTRVADHLLDDLKRLHWVDRSDDPGVNGGLPGAFPIHAPYGAFSVPNWGVKFFADVLLQRLLPETTQRLLG